MIDSLAQTNVDALAAGINRVSDDLNASLGTQFSRAIRPDMRNDIDAAHFHEPPIALTHLLYALDCYGGVNIDRVDGADPATQFGRLVANAARLTQLDIYSEGETCAETEPRFIRSLNNQGRNSYPHESPGVVLTQAGETVGYRKGNGFTDLAYVTRSFSADIDGETRAFPLGTIAAVTFDDEYENKLDSRTEPTIVELDKVHVENGGMVRMASFALPAHARQLYTKWASLGNSNFEQEEAEASTTTH